MYYVNDDVSQHLCNHYPQLPLREVNGLRPNILEHHLHNPIARRRL